MASLLIKNGRVLSPEDDLNGELDLLVEDGVIRQMAPGLASGAEETIEARGQIVAPGFIDLHCHLREPGREDEETIKTGGRAALAGGFTRVCCMPNTEPPIDTENVVRAIITESARQGQAEVLPVGAATKRREGNELAEIGAMHAAGAVAVSDDGNPIAGAEAMRRVLEYAKVFDIPVISHCEDPALSRDGVMNEGAVSARLGLPGIPATAETAMVIRDILLADATKGRLHIAHVSCRGSVELVRWAKQRGIPITAETCPHYLALTEDALAGFDSNLKMNPPLRTEADRIALKEGLADGTIDAIATDHAPHLASEKEVEFSKAPFGIIGFETAFSLGLQELVSSGYLKLGRYLAKLTVAPARILGLSARIAVGEKANLVVFDPELKWTYKPGNIRSKSRNSPFLGRELTGKVLAAVLGTRTFKF